MTDSSQKFISRNRAPRVQIEYDVELYGSEKKVQLPFVMGVMSDLAGKSKVAQPAIDDRRFLEIDVDSFDERMKAMQPRAAFSVPNTLTGDGNLSVDLTFEKMADFAPEAIAAKVEPLRELLQARTQLSDLMTYMDGKTGAESLIEKVISDPNLLTAISQAGAGPDMTDAALDSLRAVQTPATDQQDMTSDVLGALKSAAPPDSTAAEDTTESVLAGLSRTGRENAEPEDSSAGVLDGLRQSAPDADPEPDARTDALKSLRPAGAAETDVPDTQFEDALASLPTAAVDSSKNPAGDVLAGIERQPEESHEKEDTTSGVLDGLRQTEADPSPELDSRTDVLDGLRTDATETDDAPDAHVDDALTSLIPPPVEPEPDDLDDILSTVPDAVDPEPGGTSHDTVLSDLTAAAPENPDSPDTIDAALESLPEMADPQEAVSDAGNVLADLADSPVQETQEHDIETRLSDIAEGMAPPAEKEAAAQADDVLSDLVQVPVRQKGNDTDPGAVLERLGAVETDLSAADPTDDVLADLADVAEPVTPPSDSVADALESLAETEPPVAGADDLDDALQSLSGGTLDAGSSGGDTPQTETPPESNDPDDLPDAPDTFAEQPAESDLTTDAGLGAGAAGETDLDDLLGDLDDAPGNLPVTEDVQPDIAEGADKAEAQQAETADDGTVQIDDGLDDLGDLFAEPDSVSDFEENPGLDDFLGDLDAAPDNVGEELQPATPDRPAVEHLPEGQPVDTAAEDSAQTDTGLDDLDDLLGDLDASPDSADAEPAAFPDDQITQPDMALDDLDDLLAEPDPVPVAVAEDEPPEPISSLDDLDDFLAEPDRDPGTAAEDELVVPASGLNDLDDLLGDLDADQPEAGATEIENPAENPPTDSDAGLDDLLGDLGEQDASPLLTESAQMDTAPDFAFGTMTGDRPGAEQLKRRRFRLAILGDFSGRAVRGILETGDDLAARDPILLDPDTVEQVIERFAAPLVLPIGKDGAGVEVPLRGLDDLHPDELYENVALFSELAALRARLGSGATADSAMNDLLAWGEAHGTPVSPTRSRSGGNAVPADRKLSDFQKLIGDTKATLTEASPLEDLLARVVGPHIRAVPDADALAMQGAVDYALSAAMRLILHHPEFQSVEAQWRSIDLIARSIETDDTLDVMLYDISAEEIAADLASAADLAQSGFARLLTEGPLDEDTGRGGYSALIGLYGFEETPPHADILGRIARVAAHVDAPFLASISPAFLETEKEDRHPMVADAWDQLRAMPEAGHLGLVSPRFLLRRPYGAKSEPIYEFPFEEFTMSAGLGGMLWANPVVLVAILLAKSFRENGVSMGLGSIMSLGEMPYHFVTDKYGDQVALPCTERNLTLEKVEKVMARGVMPVVSIKGRDEIRLASFQSLAGGDILGPWSGVAPPPPSPPKPAPVAEPETDNDLGLDDLLAEFDDAATETPEAGSEDIDADLAALLEDL